MATITLDVATLLGLLAIDSAVFAALVFATVWNRLGEGRREWVAALCSQTLGWALLAVGGDHLHAAALGAALLLNRLGLVFYALAMARLAGKRWHPLWYLVPLIGSALVQLPPIFAWAWRPLVSELLALMLVALCILPLLGTDRQLSRTSRGIVIASFALGIVGMVGRLSLSGNLQPTTIGLLMDTPANAARLMLIHLNIIFGNVGIALLYRERATAEVTRQSHLDPLTELFNRASFLEQASRELRQAARAGTPACALIVNLDGFKQINQRYGQLAGDRVLRHFSGLLNQALRTEDLCARWSGGSFAILLTDAGLDGARRLADRLTEAVSGAHVQPDGIRYRISIGTAEAAAQGEDTFELFARAESALRGAKAASASIEVERVE